MHFYINSTLLAPYVHKYLFMSIPRINATNQTHTHIYVLRRAYTRISRLICKHMELDQERMDHVIFCHAQERAVSLQHQHLRAYILLWIRVRRVELKSVIPQSALYSCHRFPILV